MGSDAKERLLSMNPWVDLDWPERCKQAAARIAELEAALSAAAAENDALKTERDDTKRALQEISRLDWNSKPDLVLGAHQAGGKT